MAGLFSTNAEDQRFALVMLQLLTRANAPQPSVYFVHEGLPIAKGRPRFTKNGHAFTPARTRSAEQDLAWVLKAHVPNRPLVGPLALVAMFYLVDQRPTDGDNLLKLVKDAGNLAEIWHDDSQVVACAAVVDIDAVRPRTVVAIAQAMSGLRRMPSTKTRKRRVRA